MINLCSWLLEPLFILCNNRHTVQKKQGNSSQKGSKDLWKDVDHYKICWQNETTIWFENPAHGDHGVEMGTCVWARQDVDPKNDIRYAYIVEARIWAACRTNREKECSKHLPSEYLFDGQNVEVAWVVGRLFAVSSSNLLIIFLQLGLRHKNLSLWVCWNFFGKGRIERTAKDRNPYPRRRQSKKDRLR